MRTALLMRLRTADNVVILPIFLVSSVAFKTYIIGFEYPYMTKPDARSGRRTSPLVLTSSVEINRSIDGLRRVIPAIAGIPKMVYRRTIPE
jgi:hypothetical protein